jgi:DNA-binding transcriptional LysR family regulator
MLDVRRLRVLREVATRGSFSAAAEALHFTQSAVSQQIAALEREAGMPLVDRSARGVRLTHAGEVLVGHADAILARLGEAEAELEAMAGLRGGRIRMAAFPTAGATIAPVAISRFREQHPGVDIKLFPADPDDGIDKLRAGEVDLALLIDTPWECATGDGLDRVHLLDDPMYVCLPRSHRHAGKVRLRLEDLADDPWLLGTTGVCPDTAILLRACAAAGFEPRIAFNSDDYGAIQGFVAAGMGVSLIPDLALVTVRDDVVIREIAPRPAVRQIVAATLAGSYRSPQVAAMLEILAAVGAEFQTGRRELALAV